MLRTLIVGAGRAGRALARDLAEHPGYGLHPIGFLDDAAAETGTASETASETETGTGTETTPPHLGTLADLPRLVAEHRAHAVALAIPGLPAPRIHELTDAAVGAGAAVRYLPWHTAVLSREAAGSDLRSLDIRALIDGPRPAVVSPEVKEIVTGKRILVTGAGGPLGAEICRQLHAFSPGALFLLDGDERALDRLRADLWGDAPLDESYAALLTVDIGDREQTDHVVRELRPEVVFHAAGLRNASVVERRPSRGVKANVLGTDNLVRAAMRHGTERFIQFSVSVPASASASADADPASMLHATHRIAEAVVQAAGHKRAKRGAETVFATVRVGDVLDARDSLLTFLADQIRAGGPVAITHPEASRCFATVEEAVALALDASRMAAGGEIYLLDLGKPVRVTDVVSRFTRQYKLPGVPIRYVGPGCERAGGTRSRIRVSTPQPQIFKTAPPDTDPVEYARLPERLEKLYKAADKNRDPKVRQMLAKLAGTSESEA
jgi:FlaA1/EpsC-like NDP-sugar epimerase